MTWARGRDVLRRLVAEGQLAHIQVQLPMERT